MTGVIDSEGSPIIRLSIGGRDWRAIIDTGFNGDLELPQALASHFVGVPSGIQRSILASGIVVDDEMFMIDFPFDGEIVVARASFAPVNEILIGTGLLSDYLLEIDFPARTLQLTRLRGP